MDPFRYVDVYWREAGNTLISWDIRPSFNAPGPWTFNVYASLSGVGAWALVGSTVNRSSLVDTDRRVYGQSLRLAYFVELVDGAATRYPSALAQATGSWQGADRQLAAEIVRKEWMLLTKKTGTCGYLYKRRHWGTPCPDCLDPDTGMALRADCPTCLGTGITGGYFDPVDYWVAIGPSRPRRLQTDEQRGTVEEQKVVGRGLKCPRLDTNDVWIVAQTDERYIVQALVPMLFRGFPLLYEQIELRLAATTDPVYMLPRPDVQESLSSSG